MLSMCAHPDALPHASNKPDTPGFQIEIGRALAAALGVRLHVDWIIPRMRAGLADCDMLLDTIADPAAQRGPIRLSQPYQKSGVALALRRGSDSVQRFEDLPPRQRVGVMISSLASKLLNQRGLYTVPYAFEGEMVADLAKGEIDAAAVSPATIAYYIRAPPRAGTALCACVRRRAGTALEPGRGPSPQRRCAGRCRQQGAGGVDARWRAGAIYGRYGVEFRRP